jgi:excisionase family DNA binding protein
MATTSHHNTFEAYLALVYFSLSNIFLLSLNPSLRIVKSTKMDLLNLDNRLQSIEKALLLNKTVFNPKEAADYINISLSTLYKLTSAGTIPFSKPNGKLIYFSRLALDQWLLSAESKSVDQKDILAATFTATSNGTKRA